MATVILKKKATGAVVRTEDKKMGVEAFVLRAIDKLSVGNKVDPKTGKPYKGIHTVFSGFNGAFREYYPDMDPITTTRELAKAGKIQSIPAFKGARIGRPGTWASSGGGSAAALNKILG